MSFTNPDQGTEQQADQLTFKVGDREFNAESAATKIENADNHISKIEQENAEFKARLAAMEAQLEQSTKIDEALQTMKLQQSNTTENVQPEQHTTGLSEEQIAEITQRKMEEYLASQTAKQQQDAAQALADKTFTETAETLRSIYGESVDEAVSKKASELGVPPAELFNMAKSPATAKLLLETMTPKKASSDTTPSGGYNTSGLYGTTEPSFLKGHEGKSLTSSTILDVLKEHGANY
jgi:hypothetical protein